MRSSRLLDAIWMAMQVALDRIHRGTCEWEEAGDVLKSTFQGLREALSPDSIFFRTLDLDVRRLGLYGPEYGNVIDLVINRREVTDFVSEQGPFTAAASRRRPTDGTEARAAHVFAKSVFLFDAASHVAEAALLRMSCGTADWNELAASLSAIDDLLRLAAAADETSATDVVRQDVGKLVERGGEYEQARKVLEVRGHGLPSPTTDPLPPHVRRRIDRR